MALLWAQSESHRISTKTRPGGQIKTTRTWNQESSRFIVVHIRWSNCCSRINAGCKERLKVFNLLRQQVFSSSREPTALHGGDSLDILLTASAVSVMRRQVLGEEKTEPRLSSAHSAAAGRLLGLAMPLPVQWLAVGLGFGYLIHSGSISWKQVGCTLVVLSGAAVFLLYRFQEALLYQPRIFPQHITPKDNPAGMRHPGEHRMPWEDVRITAADGVNLHAWFVRPDDIAARRSRATLLFFHENAGNMGLRMENLRMMYEAIGVNVVILSYRGYGESHGIPEEEGIYLDAEATLQWALQRDDIDHNRIVLFGRSLGGGVAIDLASKHDPAHSGLKGEVAAVVVENTFASISAMVDVVFPFVAFLKRLILRMKWESVKKIPHITKPILFLSGAQVRKHTHPYPHSVRLLAALFPPLACSTSSLLFFCCCLNDVFIGSTYLTHRFDLSGRLRCLKRSRTLVHTESCNTHPLPIARPLCFRSPAMSCCAHFVARLLFCVLLLCWSFLCSG